MADFSKIGSSEGPNRGPEPGDGATIAGQAGNEDMEGTPPHALPDRRGQAAPVPDQTAGRSPFAGWLLALVLGLAALGIVWLIMAFLAQP